MKHRSSQIVFDHWNEKRGSRALPERSEIDPAQIRRALGDTFVLAFNPLPDHPFRLAGTRVCALFGRELKGAAFTQLWSDVGSVPVTRLMATACDESVGVAAGVQGLTEDGQRLDLELLLLPLRHCGQTHLRLIGTLAPLLAPQWLATTRLVSLAITGHRFLGYPRQQPSVRPAMIASPATAPLSAPAPLSPSLSPLGAPRLRRGFMVYDGGQA
ncbi:MAG: PAS domain-containing protein [Variibacter sp.]|nr:PAS domain-containing protein [Variibacter sp.]